MLDMFTVLYDITNMTFWGGNFISEREASLICFAAPEI
jgi:hypothetical protein